MTQGQDRYTDPIYGITIRHVFPHKQVMQATGQDERNLYSMPFKAKLVKFGIIVGASAIVNSSETGFMLKTCKAGAVGGTILATFVPGTLAGSLGAFDCTGKAPETATWIPKNRVVQPGVQSVGGATADCVGFYMDYRIAYDTT